MSCSGLVIWQNQPRPKDCQGDGGPQGRSLTGGGGLARVPILRVCKHLFPRIGVAQYLQLDAQTREGRKGLPERVATSRWTLGILGTRRRKQVVSRIWNRLWWQVDLRASQMVDNSENSGQPVFQGQARWAVEYSRRKIIETQPTSMVNMAILTCCTGLFMPRTSSVSTGQSQSGVDRIPEKQAKADPKVLARCLQKFQIKQEDLKSLVDIPRLAHASGKRILQNLKDFNSMPFTSKIEYLRTTAKIYHPIEKGNYCVTTTLDDDGWRKPRGFKAVRINWCRKSNGSSLKYWDCCNYWCSWYSSASTITEFTRILRMDFDKSWSRKNSEWNSSSQLWHRELQFLVAREGRQPQWCVSRIFKTCRGKSRARLTRFEQCQNDGWTLKHASGNRCLHNTGSPSLLEK